MPIYEYDCPACGRFEAIQRPNAKPLTTCPNCAEAGKKTKVRRAISAAAFHLKGSGWYKTDYASKGSNGASDGKAKTPAKTDNKTDNKSEAKPKAEAAVPTSSE